MKSIKNSELREGGEYAHLDWKTPEKRESAKLFVKFKALRDEPLELRDLPVGAHVVRCFNLPTIKNYEVKVNGSLLSGARLAATTSRKNSDTVGSELEA